MKLPLVSRFLESLNPSKVSGDGRNIQCRCVFCGDSDRNRDSTHLSIRYDVERGEPLLYQCFRSADVCGAKGALTTDTLQRLGCTDMNTILELAKYNATVSKHLDSGFRQKNSRDFQLVNLNTKYNFQKLQYINHRLGSNLSISDLRDLKIQLGLGDFINLNAIKKLAFSVNTCEQIDKYCIGFMSMYSDYLIMRDFSDDKVFGEFQKPVTGRRYTMYRTSGKPNPDDMKLYCIPTDIDLLDPHSANINVAEGTFTILGAYLNTDIGKDRRNNVFLANCGTGYKSTIEHVCKQYGLLKVRINIFSDSEISVGLYQKLYNGLKGRLDIRAFNVYYNQAAEDFGHAEKDIKIRKVTIY